MGSDARCLRAARRADAAMRMDLPPDTPDDVRPGTRRTEDLDEHTGASS